MPPPPTAEPESLPPVTTEPAPTDPVVIEPVTLGATLGWSMPTQRANSEPLLAADIIGYEVYYTSADGKVTDIVVISGATISSVVVMVPVAGTYCFSIATVTTSGEKSTMSAMVEAVIQ